MRRLGALYRSAIADLAHARRAHPKDPTTLHLEALVARTRPLVYGSVGTRGSLLHFATTGYWRRVRERPVALLVSIVALMGPTLLVGVWSNAHPVEAGRVAQISPLTAGLADRPPRDPDTQKVTAIGTNTGMAAFIFTNNARVALAAFAGGLTGGVLTLISLLQNGLVLGLAAGLSIHGGYGDSIWRLIVPHGVLELSLISAAGAAGLRVGWALVHPGHRTRGDALAEEGRGAVELALGTAFLLVPTGLVEGFVTPRGLPLPAALAVGIGLGVAYWTLVLWRGRPERGAAAAPAGGVALATGGRRP